MERRSIVKGCVRLLVSLFFIGAAAGPAAGDPAGESDGEDPNFKYHTVTTKEGLHYRVPEDMPIVTRHGIQVPLPFDEYMYAKFKKIDGRLDRIEQTLQRIEKRLEGPPEKENPDASRPVIQ